jgi:hypothetical protein
VHARPVDPRDAQWELDAPLYRTYFWSDPNHCDEWEVQAVDVREAMSWADSHVEGRELRPVRSGEQRGGDRASSFGRGGPESS